MLKKQKRVTKIFFSFSNRIFSFKTLFFTKIILKESSCLGILKKDQLLSKKDIAGSGYVIKAHTNSAVRILKRYSIRLPWRLALAQAIPQSWILPKNLFWLTLRISIKCIHDPRRCNRVTLRLRRCFGYYTALHWNCVETKPRLQSLHAVIIDFKRLRLATL